MKPFSRQALSRPKPYDSLPLTLNRRRVYIFPTRHGLVFLSVLAAMLVGAVNYNNNLAFLLVFLLGGILLTGMFHTYHNLHGLRLVSASVEPVFAGQKAGFVFRIDARSRSRRAIGWCFAGNRPILENLEPEGEHRVRVDLPTERRGPLRPDRLTVFSRYPLGLFNAWAILKPDIVGLVYPARISADLHLTSDERAPDKAEKTAGTPSNQPGTDDFHGLKPYQPGHVIGHIAWKALARGRGVYVKDFLADRRGNSVMLDYGAAGPGDPEARLSRLCDMVIKADAMNLEYGIRLPDETIPPDKGDRHRHFCLKRLALFGLPENNP